MLRVPCLGYFSYSNLHGLTNSIIKISEVEVRLVAGNTALVCMIAYVQVWGKELHVLPSHTTYGDLQLRNSNIQKLQFGSFLLDSCPDQNQLLYCWDD